MEHSIRLSGKFNIEFAPQIDHDYKIALIGGITSIAKTSNDDGSYSYTYSLKPLNGEILDDKGEIKKISKKGSKSQVLRFKIEGLGLDYDREMNYLLDNIEEILANKFN